MVKLRSQSKPEPTEQNDIEGSMAEEESGLPDERDSSQEAADISSLKRKGIKTSNVTTPTPLTAPSKSKSTQERHKKPDRNRYWIIAGAVAAVLSAALACHYYYSTPCSIKRTIANDTELFHALESILKDEEDIVRSIMFLHSPEHAKAADCLIANMANDFACTKKNTNETSEVTPEELNSFSDVGILMEKYKTSLHHAVVVKNVNEVSSTSAQIFHALCDDVTTLNAPTLFIFTIPSHDVNSSKPWTVARNILEEVWKDLPHNILDPLLSRVIGHVFNFTPDLLTTSCT